MISLSKDDFPQMMSYPRKVGGVRNDWGIGFTIAVLAKKSSGFLARPAWVFSGGRTQAVLSLDRGVLAPIVFSAK
jgi:hypothetical protein